MAKTPLLPFRAMAEGYAALVYVNFMVSVFAPHTHAGDHRRGLHVFTVMAINVYPFEPHPTLQTLSVVLLLVMGLAVGFVYAEMHPRGYSEPSDLDVPGRVGIGFLGKIRFRAAA